VENYCELAKSNISSMRLTDKVEEDPKYNRVAFLSLIGAEK